jgi:Xaa-Pro aminopeptidase
MSFRKSVCGTNHLMRIFQSIEETTVETGTCIGQDVVGEKRREMAVDPERHARIIAALANSTLDAVVSSSATEVLLLTGYWPVMAASLAIFAASGEVYAIVPEDEVDLAENTTGATLVPYKPGDLEQLANPIRALSSPLSSVMKSLGLSSATIGVEFRQGMQPASYAASTTFHGSLLELLQQLQPTAKYVSSDKLLDPLKATKTAKELELMDKAAKVAEAAFAKGACIQPGMCETEVAAAAQSAFDTAAEAKCLQRSYGFFYCMSGPNSAKASAAFARTRQRTIENGDLVMIHANTCADGYWTDITRTYTVGTPSERHQAMSVAIQEARAEALRAIRPGVAARDVDHAARKVMVAHGFGEAFRHATGHGVGFAAANPNGLPRIHPQSPDVLEDGMTFNIEPAAYFDGYGGMRHCDVVAVAPEGANILTDF